jgi:hypothetical protein
MNTRGNWENSTQFLIFPISTCVDITVYQHRKCFIFVKYKTNLSKLKDAVQSVCKQRLCLHFGIQNIEFYSTTIYIFMILEYNKLSRDNNQALQEHKMK